MFPTAVAKPCCPGIPGWKHLAGLLAVLLCLLTTGAAQAAPTKTLTFSCWLPEELPAFRAFENLYRESFAAIGYEFRMLHRPPMRSLAEASQGVTDGECARIANYLEVNPGSPLLRVDVMVAKTDLEAWGHDNTLKFTGPKSLLDPRYRIAYGKGTVAMELLKARLPLRKFEEVGSIQLGIKMLARKRFDILIAPQALFKQELARSEIDVELYYMGKLMVMEGHPYMHNRHREIIPAFTAELRKRTPEGGLLFP